MIRLNARAAALVNVVAIALAMCADSRVAPAAPAHSAAQNSRQLAETPLDFDPARPERVDGWWSNGQELLRLESNGAYRMWLTADRFASPAEVGAWRRSNYVLFDLEPYRAKPGTRIRVQLVKDGGQTCIAREGMKQFKRCSAPPRVFGDEVLGVWSADREQLLVLDNGRYEYRRLGPQTGISQHDGIWRTEGRTLLLAPDSTAVSAISLQGELDANGALVLRGAGGVLQAMRPEPAALEAAPAPASAAPAPSPSQPATPPPPAEPKPTAPSSQSPVPSPPTVPPSPPMPTATPVPPTQPAGAPS